MRNIETRSGRTRRAKTKNPGGAGEDAGEGEEGETDDRAFLTESRHRKSDPASRTRDISSPAAYSNYAVCDP